MNYLGNRGKERLTYIFKNIDILWLWREGKISGGKEEDFRVCALWRRRDGLSSRRLAIARFLIIGI